MESNTAHAGYADDGSPLYVGDCCMSLLAETAARFYWMPRPYDLPKPESSLWRYMDFSKFVALINDKALYFARADCLGDQFEEAKGVVSNKTVWDDHYLRFFREAIRNPPEGYKCELSNGEIAHEAERLLQEMAVGGKKDLLTTYVSCWHENEVESEALWRLYCPPPPSGVALRTTFSALTKSLGDDSDINVGRVRYVDFRKGFAGVNDAIFHKRQSLSHEKEVRAVVRNREDFNKLGLSWPVDMKVLLQTVIVSPFAPSWFGAVLKETMARFGVPAEITSSELTAKTILLAHVVGGSNLSPNSPAQSPHSPAR